MILLWMFVALWGASALAAAALLNRDDHAGTGFVWGLTLGPAGFLVVLRRRTVWEGRWQRDRSAAAQARKEQAWREWRGY
jgi:hypothetical protein